MDFSKPNAFQRLRDHPNLIVLSVGVLLLIVGVLILILGLVAQRRGRSSTKYKIGGSWTYTAVEGDPSYPYTYSGTVEITQHGQEVELHGWRTLERRVDIEGTHDTPCEYYWGSVWAWLDEAGVLRYEYYAYDKAQAGTNMGYARVDLVGKKRTPGKMRGYFILPANFGPDPKGGRGTIAYSQVVENKPSWFNRWFRQLPIREEVQREQHVTSSASV